MHQKSKIIKIMPVHTQVQKMHTLHLTLLFVNVFFLNPCTYIEDIHVVNFLFLLQEKSENCALRHVRMFMTDEQQEQDNGSCSETSSKQNITFIKDAVSD